MWGRRWSEVRGKGARRQGLQRQDLRRRSGARGARVLAAALPLLLAPSSSPAQDATPPTGSPRAIETTASIAADEFVVVEDPVLQVERAGGPIIIDGDLSDPGWRGSARATHFHEIFPGDNVRPQVGSEVLVTYDDAHLYVAFIAEDDPGEVRASLRQRDEMFSDDFFGILLDTYGNASWAYEILVNPLGVQGDLLLSSTNGEDSGFDLIWESEGRITDSGYQVEVAIPFASLRFPDRDVQIWRATFFRARQRGSREEISWSPSDRDDPCFMCQWGTLTGLQGVEPGGALEILPSLVASQRGERMDPNDPASPFENGAVDAEPSLSAKYSFPGGLTAQVTLNPDFSQVESDAALIDVNTTFALFFPERRPFFQEGSDLFGTWLDAVYTRSLNDPQVAVKLTGRMGGTSIGYLGGRDENSPILLPFEESSFIGQGGPSIVNVLRGRQTFGEESYAGLVVTDRRYEDGGGSNTVGGADVLLRFLENYRLEFQLLWSHTAEAEVAGPTAVLEGETFERGAHTAVLDGEEFWGHAQYTSLERDARTWDFDFDYWAYSPAFRAANGFVTQNDYRQASMFHGVTFYPETEIVDRVSPNVFLLRSWNFGGERKTEHVRPELFMQLTGQTFFELAWFQGSENFRDTELSGIGRVELFTESNFSEPVSAGFFVGRGDFVARRLETPIVGTGTDAEVFATFKPLSRLVLSPTFRFSELETPAGEVVFSGYTLRARVNYQFSRELSLRLVTQYDDFSGRFALEPLITYRVNPFTLFYIGSTLGYRDYGPEDGVREIDRGLAQTSRQFFAKFQYLLRL